jgi:hypothetical protein
VPPEPGISARCFAEERERFGPADYKIWHTSQITARSVGRGWSVPAGMIPPQVVQQINELTGRLGYLPVDESWGTAAVPADLRAADSRHPARPGFVSVEPLPRSSLVSDRLSEGLSRMDSQFSHRWGPCTAESFTLVVLPPTGTGSDEENQWRVDPAAGTVTGVTGIPDDGDDTAWDIVGSADAWQAVLSGRTNLGVAMRRCELRYCGSSEAGDVGPEAADTRIGMLADLLGLRSSWQPSEEPRALV